MDDISPAFHQNDEDELDFNSVETPILCRLEPADDMSTIKKINLYAASKHKSSVDMQDVYNESDYRIIPVSQKALNVIPIYQQIDLDYLSHYLVNLFNSHLSMNNSESAQTKFNNYCQIIGLHQVEGIGSNAREQYNDNSQWSVQVMIRLYGDINQCSILNMISTIKTTKHKKSNQEKLEDIISETNKYLGLARQHYNNIECYDKIVTIPKKQIVVIRKFILLTNDTGLIIEEKLAGSINKPVATSKTNIPAKSKISNEYLYSETQTSTQTQAYTKMQTQTQPLTKSQSKVIPTPLQNWQTYKQKKESIINVTLPDLGQVNQQLLAQIQFAEFQRKAEQIKQENLTLSSVLSMMSCLTPSNQLQPFIDKQFNQNLQPQQSQQSYQQAQSQQFNPINSTSVNLFSNSGPQLFNNSWGNSTTNTNTIQPNIFSNNTTSTTAYNSSTINDGNKKYNTRSGRN